VVDPVMIATSGATLLEADAVAAYGDLLMPMARVITPNLPEAEVLLGERIGDVAAMESAALRLAKKFRAGILIKGGHLDGPECVDVLAEKNQITRFVAPRIPVAGSHGTGCTLSAAIAAALALGDSLPLAIESAKSYLGQTLRQSYVFASTGKAAIHALNQGTTFRTNEA
jgi:hydroxymethylpyrimidine/phosphomethylpyrimidine kinase